MLVSHLRPDGERCLVASRVGEPCLHCGTRPSRTLGKVDGDPLSEESTDHQEASEELLTMVESAPTPMLIRVLEARGVETGSIELGGVRGKLLVFRIDKTSDDPAER